MINNIKKIIIDGCEFIYDESREYVKDGEVRCKKCHQKVTSEPKLIIGTKKIIRLKCKCMDEFDLIENQKTIDNKKSMKIEELKNICFSKNPKYRNACLNSNNIDNELQYSFINDYLSNYIKHKEYNQGLFIYGNVGCGKTYLAAALANAIIEKYQEDVKFLNYSELVDAYTNFNDINQKYEYEKQLLNVSLLIIDDFTTIRNNSNFMLDLTYKIINRRYETMLPTIFTSNIDFEYFKKEKNNIDKYKIYSRFYDSIIPLKMVGEDLRVKYGKEKFMKLFY